jgi:hypothetical protein
MTLRRRTRPPDFPTSSSFLLSPVLTSSSLFPQIAPLFVDPRFDKGATSRLGLVSPSLFMYLSTMDAALRASSEGCFDVVVRYEELVERQLDLLHHLVVKLFPERAQQLDNPVRAEHTWAAGTEGNDFCPVLTTSPPLAPRRTSAKPCQKHLIRMRTATELSLPAAAETSSLDR